MKQNSLSVPPCRYAKR